MRGSCHLDRALNVETGIKYQVIFVQGIERISIKILQSISSFFFIQQKTKINK